MRPTLLGIGLVIVIAGSAGRSSRAQELGHGVTPADVERGGQIFVASCAACHGLSGDGIPGVDLGSGAFRRATTDRELAALIRTGIPGTPMPPNALTEDDATRVVAYLRALPAARLAAGPGSGLRGDATNGKRVFEGKGRCGDCHLVNGSGGFLGPDLSSVGLTRSVAELERSLLDPDAEIRTGNRTAVIVRRDGTTIAGRLLNHDTYSIQMIDAVGTLVSVDKAGVRSWDIAKGSGMPKLDGTLTPADIADVVAYLRTLQAPPPAGQGGGRGGPAGGRAGGPAVGGGGRQ
jgi:putative heme-binding domain-containing protein